MHVIRNVIFLLGMITTSHSEQDRGEHQIPNIANLQKKQRRPPIRNDEPFGFRFNRAQFVDKRILAVLENPKLFNTRRMLPFGIEGEKKALIVGSYFDKTRSAISAFFKPPAGNSNLNRMKWRLIPIDNLNSFVIPWRSAPTFFARNGQFFVVNEHIVQTTQEGMSGTAVPDWTKYAMGMGENATGDSTMLNSRNTGNLISLRRVVAMPSYESNDWAELLFVPDSATDVGSDPKTYRLRSSPSNENWGGGINALDLVQPYAGLSKADLWERIQWRPERTVYVNVCSVLDGDKRRIENLIKQDGFSPYMSLDIILSMGGYLPEMKKEYTKKDEGEVEPSRLYLRICSPAKLMTKVWPL